MSAARTKRVGLVFGTRPEAIKLAPVIRALRAAPGLEPVVISTGQHSEMLEQVLERFEIVPDHRLEAMRPGQSLAGLTARLVAGLDEILGTLALDACLVQGDTTTAFVGALCAFYQRIPVGHVEAGLRTGDLAAPFPEEGNRRLVTPLASQHFAPTELARENLEREGVAPERIHVTGNTVIDALFLEIARQEEPGETARVRSRLAEHLGDGWWRRPFVLVTGHRRESFGRGFGEICAALRALSEAFSEHAFVYPVHLNPNVLAPVRDALGDRPNVHLLAPQSYAEFVALMQACRLVLTDSGGVQEEAPGLAKPVLVMRDTTERPEGIAAGTVRLVGTERTRIAGEVAHLLRDEAAYRAMARARNPYGDGRASERILAVLARADTADVPLVAGRLP